MNRRLEQERQYLAQLLEAIQRSAYFLSCSQRKIDWPLQAGELTARRKDAELLETLAAINERFAKLQDTLSAAMRHAAVLMNESTDSFLHVLAFFEKIGVVESTARWQQARLLRNIAAHDYETDYEAIAEHFNALADLSAMLLRTGRQLLARIDSDLGIQPLTGDFDPEFRRLFDDE